MNLEKTIIRDSGTQIKIIVEFVITGYIHDKSPRYIPKVFWRRKGAKKWNDEPKLPAGIIDPERTA